MSWKDSDGCLLSKRRRSRTFVLVSGRRALRAPLSRGTVDHLHRFIGQIRHSGADLPDSNDEQFIDAWVKGHPLGVDATFIDGLPLSKALTQS